MYLIEAYSTIWNSFNQVHSSLELVKSDSKGLFTTGSILHIKCLRLCNINKIKRLSVFTTRYPAFVYILNGASSIILQCKYTSLEELIREISSSDAFRRCQPIPLLVTPNSTSQNPNSFTALERNITLGATSQKVNVIIKPRIEYFANSILFFRSEHFDSTTINNHAYSLDKKFCILVSELT